MGYILRYLDPAIDHELFVESYSWRRPKRHTQPDRMSIEHFTATDQNQLTFGLFNGDFLAVYFLEEIEPAVFQVHMTSKRKVARETLLHGAAAVRDLFFENGASELVAWLVPENKPLRAFVEALGFQEVCQEEWACESTGQSDTLAAPGPPARKFIKYAIRR